MRLAKKANDGQMIQQQTFLFVVQRPLAASPADIHQEHLVFGVSRDLLPDSFLN